MNDALSLLVILVLLAVIIGTFNSDMREAPKGRWQYDNNCIGSDGRFLSHDRRKAAETIVNENAERNFNNCLHRVHQTSGSSETPP